MRRFGRGLVGLLLVGVGASAVSGAIRLTDRPSPRLVPGSATDHRARTKLRFLVFGDSGTGNAKQAEIGKAMAEACGTRGGCDFALVAGDLLYGARDFEKAFRNKFESPYEPLGRLDFWMVAGNHDWKVRGLVDAEVRYSESSPRWRMPSHDYGIPLLPDWIRLYGLDTTKLSLGFDDEQVQRAREELCEGAGWRLLFGHHPVYSSGYHANSRGELEAIKTRILEPLIDACGVQFYFSGHDHHQEHLTSPGFEQIVQGAAGKLRRVYRPRQRAPRVRQLAAASRLGFALVEATPQRLSVRFYGENDAGEVRPFHCRAYVRADFDDPETRSTPCGDVGAGE